MAYEMGDWAGEFISVNAVFTRPEDPKAPHVALHGSHQTVYFNSDQVTQYPVTLRDIASQWADSISRAGITLVDRVISHAPQGCAPALSLAQELDATYGYATRIPGGGYRTPFGMRGETVIVVADELISGNSIRQVIAVAESQRAKVLHVVPCLANLSLQDKLDDRTIIPAATFEPEYLPLDAHGQCQLCHVGSVALSPRPSWAQLQEWTATPAP